VPMQTASCWEGSTQLW